MNYRLYNDYELIYMVREKDDYSYDILFQKYIPIIKRIAFDYYKNYDGYGYDLDDFIQEGYVAFQKSLHSFNEEKDVLFYTFVVLCIHRGLISFCKKITSDRKNISRDYLVSLDEVSISDGIDDVSNYISYCDTYQRIWDIVYDLSFDIICVFELRWNHFKFHEIGDILNLSIRTVRSYYQKAIYAIQKQLTNCL